ncbi:hypothetical protein ACFDR9_004783 [Janthinobacterium sp. CG_23.3]|uniref:hypothetical protein n=1 Tax=unclassified Janthinobacterium TaxID=2610881 RepID=UPI000345BBF7|nr:MULTISPECIES: hypothetical protein [unclassified Janthinobacterium]MEC5161283.1 hypothetical protein [Janthinobacterium sp. CG_S6]
MANRLSQSVAQLGCLNAAWYAFGRLLHRLSRGRWALYKYQFVAQAVGTASLCRGRGAQIAVQLCQRAEQLPPDYPRRADVLAGRYAQGACSLAAVRRGELVGFLWLLFDAYQEDEVRARYLLASPQSCWDFDVWVRPQERLGLAFPRLWDEANRLLRARAVRWSCSRISAFNPGSLRAHASIGTVALGSATFLRCGRWQWMLATRAPYFHLSRQPAAFPRLSFDTSALAHPPAMESLCPTSKPSN